MTLSPPGAPIAPHQRVGTAVVAAGAQRAVVPLLAAGALPDPSLTWRVAHP